MTQIYKTSAFSIHGQCIQFYERKGKNNLEKPQIASRKLQMYFVNGNV